MVRPSNTHDAKQKVMVQQNHLLEPRIGVVVVNLHAKTCGMLS